MRNRESDRAGEKEQPRVGAAGVEAPLGLGGQGTWQWCREAPLVGPKRGRWVCNRALQWHWRVIREDARGLPRQRRSGRALPRIQRAQAAAVVRCRALAACPTCGAGGGNARHRVLASASQLVSER